MENISQPNPTIPNGNIFEAPVPSINSIPEAPEPNIPARKMPKFSLKWIFIVFGVIILLLIVALVAKTIVGRGSANGVTSITWWSVEEDDAATASLISKYEEAHPKVKINFVRESRQDYRERLTNELAKGNGPDIFEYHNSWVPMFLNNLSASKDDLSNNFYPVVSSDLKTKKGFVGIPLEYDGIALFINQDIFQSYGKNAPKTWDDLRKSAQDLTIRSPDGSINRAGAALGVTSNVNYWQDILALLILQNGGDLKTPNTTTGQSALTFYNDFSKIDHVWDNTLPDSMTAFGQGQVAMYFGKYGDAYTLRQLYPNTHFAVVPLPQLPSNSALIPSVSYASYWVNGVSNKSANANIAWDFLKFMSTSDSLSELYKNEQAIRGHGNLYPRPDMQSQLLSDQLAGPFIYQAPFAKSWYLYANTSDGPSGINTLLSKPYGDAIDAINLNSQADKALQTAQISITQILSTYGLAVLPKATP
jgi:multiple sugar transport system substrate-binding protein